MGGADDRVQAREESISLPTYAIRGENRNPIFGSRYGVVHIYPYTLLDDVDPERSDRTYRSLILENRFLRVTVIPDLGGRVYSIFDKISDREVFYRNAVVRFAPLAVRGAFFSGGLEFSFPVAHAPTTCDRVNWDIRANEDGSASIAFGGIEHISRLRWMITLTLFPGCSAMAQDVDLTNPGVIPGRYHYWTNASLEANEGTEFIYPFRRARSYEYAGLASWPVARLDLIEGDKGLPGMEGVPMWPARRMQTPINFRWQRNMLAQVSIFGRDVEWDYFGAWQHKVDHGYAHIAKSRDVSGMKLWSWGNAPVGVVNQTALTDDGSVYAETQCGAMETQLDFDFLQPCQTRSWREWWLPLRKIGGLTCASEALGASLKLTPHPEEGRVQLTVGICPARELRAATVRLAVGSTVLLNAAIKISPQLPWIHNLDLPAVDVADKPLSLLVTDAEGSVLLDSTLSREPQPPEAYEAPHTAEPATSDDLFQLGVSFEQLDNREKARGAYAAALKLNQDNVQASLRLGLMLLRSGQFTEADQHFARGEKVEDADCMYYRGVIALYEGRLGEAEKHFQQAGSATSSACAALVGLAKISVRRRDWGQAIQLLELTGKQGTTTSEPAVLLAAILRQAGQIERARSVLKHVMLEDALSHPALHEMAVGKYPESGDCAARLQRMLSDDPQYIIDLACFYMDAGLLQDALNVLEAGRTEKADAMICYLAAYASRQMGDEGRQSAWLKEARAASPELGFPSRLEEVLALQSALQVDSFDRNANFFLGNFLYAHERYDEGAAHWRVAVEGMGRHDILLRNLGLAAWERDHEPALATQWFEKALQANPQNQDLYLLLDQMYELLHRNEDRQRLLAKIEALPDIREDVRKRRIAMMVDLGHYQDAIDLLTTQRFLPLEMDQSFHEVYVQALLGRARANLETGRVGEAIRDYLQMLEYPGNLGVGEPTTRTQAQIYYLLGSAYEKLGEYSRAIHAWYQAASEHHARGTELFTYVQLALDKLSSYSQLGLEMWPASEGGSARGDSSFSGAQDHI
jgi:tetratricopeptide (TPR) repeat protein